MSEKSDNYEVEVFVKENKIIVMGKIRPIIQYENCKCYVNEDNNLGSEE